MLAPGTSTNALPPFLEAQGPAVVPAPWLGYVSIQPLTLTLPWPQTLPTGGLGRGGWLAPRQLKSFAPGNCNILGWDLQEVSLRRGQSRGDVRCWLRGTWWRGCRKGAFAWMTSPYSPCPLGPGLSWGLSRQPPANWGFLGGPEQGHSWVWQFCLNRTQVCIQTGRCQGPAPASRWGRAWAQVGVSRGQRWGWGTVRAVGGRAASEGGP